MQHVSVSVDESSEHTKHTETQIQATCVRAEEGWLVFFFLIMSFLHQNKLFFLFFFLDEETEQAKILGQVFEHAQSLHELLQKVLESNGKH